MMWPPMINYSFCNLSRATRVSSQRSPWTLDQPGSSFREPIQETRGSCENVSTQQCPETNTNASRSWLQVPAIQTHKSRDECRCETSLLIMLTMRRRHALLPSQVSFILVHISYNTFKRQQSNWMRLYKTNIWLTLQMCWSKAEI